MEDILTYADIKADDGINAVIGFCPGSPEYESRVNDAIERIYRKGDWWTSLKKAQFCVTNGCVAWPKFVGRLRALKRCNHAIPITNVWGSFLPFGPTDLNSSCFCSDYTALNEGTTPVSRNVACGALNIKVRAYTQCQKDLGKIIQLFGIDTNGQPLRTRNSDDTWVDGISLVLDKPFVSTTMDIREITRAIKPETECPIRLFQYDTVNDVLIDMAEYQPRETNPQYLFTRIGGFNCCNTTCDGQRSITALFKIALIKLRDDTDISPVQNLQAIAAMVQSIKAGQSGDRKARLEYDLDAVHEMNLQERDFVPTDQIAIDVATWGSARLEKAGIGWNI
jgi:hypothetical protein